MPKRMQPFDKFLAGLAVAMAIMHCESGGSPTPAGIGAMRACTVISRSTTDPNIALINDSVDFSNYMESKCLKDKDGTQGFRRFDIEQDLTNEQKVWRDMLDKVPPDKIPAAVIRKGKKITVKKFQPKTVEEAKAIFK